MTRTDMVQLLRTRRQLTQDSFNDETVDAWLKACAHLDYGEAEPAMLEAAAKGRVTLATFTAALHHHTLRPYDIETPAEPWEGPTDAGRAIIADIRQRFDWNGFPRP